MGQAELSASGPGDGIGLKTMVVMFTAQANRPDFRLFCIDVSDFSP